jgi:two-component system, sensor histidine kinase ChiS
MAPGLACSVARSAGERGRSDAAGASLSYASRVTTLRACAPARCKGRLPVFSVPAHDPQGPHGAAPRTSTVLIIEDDPTNLLVTEMTLRAERIPFVSVDNIDDAWDELQRSDVSLVIADLSLGGLALIERMRATPRFAHIPIIISTGERRHERIQQALDAGARGYLIKPYPLEQLLTHIRGALTTDRAN